MNTWRIDLDTFDVSQVIMQASHADRVTLEETVVQLAIENNTLRQAIIDLQLKIISANKAGAAK